MSHGPWLSCFECDELKPDVGDVRAGDTLCKASGRVLDDDGYITPAWCPLLGVALKALCQPRDERPLLSEDYGSTDEEGDPDD